MAATRQGSPQQRPDQTGKSSALDLRLPRQPGDGRQAPLPAELSQSALDVFASGAAHDTAPDRPRSPSAPERCTPASPRTCRLGRRWRILAQPFAVVALAQDLVDLLLQRIALGWLRHGERCGRDRPPLPAAGSSGSAAEAGNQSLRALRTRLSPPAQGGADDRGSGRAADDRGRARCRSRAVPSFHQRLTEDDR